MARSHGLTLLDGVGWFPKKIPPFFHPSIHLPTTQELDLTRQDLADVRARLKAEKERADEEFSARETEVRARMFQI